MTKWLNILKPEQNGSHFADDILKLILLKENHHNAMHISYNFAPYGLIYKWSSLVQLMLW